MRQHRLFILLLVPSILSTIGCTALVGLLLLAGSWPAVAHSAFFLQYPQLATASHVTPDSFAALSHALTSASILPFTLIFAIATSAAVVAYLLLGSVGQHATLEAFGTISDPQATPRQAKRQAVGGTLMQASTRLAAMLSWAVYSILFAEVIAPFSVLAVQHRIADVEHNGWLYALLVMAFLWFCLHLHLIFLRLLLLRPRVLQTDDSIATSLM